MSRYIGMLIFMMFIITGCAKAEADKQSLEQPLNVFICEDITISTDENIDSSDISLEDNYVKTDVDEQKLKQPQISTVNDDVLIFSKDDIHFLDIELTNTKDTLINIMGAPNNIEAVYEEMFEEYVYYYYYNDFGVVRIEPLSGSPEDYRISSIEITSDKHNGPRKTKVGDNYIQVIKKFPVDLNLSDEIIYDEKYLYQNPKTEDISGKLLYDENGNLCHIVYSYSVLDDFSKFSGEGYFLRYDIANDSILSIKLGLLYTN